MQKDHILTVKTVKFMLGPNNTPVNTVELHLSLNTIPYALVTFPPHVYSSKGYDIQNPNLQDVKSLMDILYSLARKETECSFDLELEDSAGGVPQKINLKKWILGDVSISTVSTIAGFVIACKIYHPAYRLLKHGYFAGNLAQPLDLSLIGTKATDLVDAADIVLDELVYSEQRDNSNINFKSIPHAATYEAVKGKIQQLTQNLASQAKPSKYLKYAPSFEPSFSYSTKPLESLLSEISGFCDADSALSIAMCSSFMPSANISAWDAFLQSCTYWGCHVIPNFLSEQLPVTPISPWGKPSYFIPEGRIANMTLPAYDANPLLGVKSADAVFGTDETGSTFLLADSMEDVTQTEMVYIPEGNLDILTGRIQSISMPPWLSSLEQAATSLRECVVDGDTSGKDQVNAGSSDSLIDEVYSAWVRYAVYAFQLGYKQTYASSMTMPLYIYTDGKGDKKKYLLPGLTLRVTSEGSGVIDGYITDITHRINIDSCSGLTTVNMTHCRPPGGYPGVAEEGDANPLYK